MNTAPPSVDVNLFAYNAQDTIAAAIESVLAQTWPAISLTIIDNASTDKTADIAAAYCAGLPNVRLHRARANGGAVVNCQRAFTLGDADFVMPKTADDLLDPCFIEQAMQVLLANPGCAMCHARGLVFSGAGVFQGAYPASHALHAVEVDPVERATTIMRHYTSAPSFWGVYRREMSDRRAPFRYRAGWDHAALAELALYGEIRHVPETLYLRRGGGKPVAQIARACTESAQRGGSADDWLSDLRWLTPTITTTHAHLETFAVAHLPSMQRLALLRIAPALFLRRWGRLMCDEAGLLARSVAPLRDRARAQPPAVREWMEQKIAEVVGAALNVLAGDVDPAADPAGLLTACRDQLSQAAGCG